MYRQPGSNMTAVEVVSAMHDGPIPADVMMAARAEDDAYRANPVRFMTAAAEAGLRWNTDHARKSIARIRALIAEGKPKHAEAERVQILCAHLKARRESQAILRNIAQGVASC